MLTALEPFLAEAETSDNYPEIRGPWYPPNFQLYGTLPASGEENQLARQILDASPAHQDLLSTARYFEHITQTNSNGYLYNAQWPANAHWNPVLIGFYQSTLLPKKYVYVHGDTIDWCAAFVNYCLARGGYACTNNAMSGSFRSFGRSVAVKDARTGDIIVFRKPGADGDVGHGHVAIFLSVVPGGFRVLGGNQRAGKSYSSVNETTILVPSSKLQFHSIRAMSSIARA